VFAYEITAARSGQAGKQEEGPSPQSPPADRASNFTKSNFAKSEHLYKEQLYKERATLQRAVPAILQERLCFFRDLTLTASATQATPVKCLSVDLLPTRGYEGEQTDYEQGNRQAIKLSRSFVISLKG